MYDLKRHGPAAYLPDLAAMVRGWRINDPHGALLWDKKRFHRLLHERGHGRLCPLVYGLLGRGLDAGKVVSLLEDEEKLVVKARQGGSGERVHLLSKTPDGYSLDGEPCPRARLEDRLRRWDGYLVTEYCTPASYAQDLFPGTPNTVRVLTMNPEDRSPFIAGSVHRIGTPRAAVDNFSQGGLSVNVRSDGSLGEAVASLGWRVNRHETHPDTGAAIQGTTVPGWASIRAQVLDVASSLPEAPYIGWDLVVTGPGEFQVIEANANPDVDLVQAHQPLLLDEASRAFYADHGLV